MSTRSTDIGMLNTERRQQLSMTYGSETLLAAPQTQHPRIVAKLQRAAEERREEYNGRNN